MSDCIQFGQLFGKIFFGNARERHLWTAKPEHIVKMVWILCPEMTLAKFPEIGFFVQNSLVKMINLFSCADHENQHNTIWPYMHLASRMLLAISITSLKFEKIRKNSKKIQ